MLAAGGVLGLLLMGVAVGGLMAGTEGPAPKTGDDDSGPDVPPDEVGQKGQASSGALWTGDFASDGSLQAPDEPGVTNAPLAELLFGEAPGAIPADSAASSTTKSDESAAQVAADDTAFAELDDLAPMQGAPGADTDTQAPATPDAEPLQYDVLDTIPFADGPDIPCVTGFDCTTDQLILDFDGTEDSAPAITIDLESSPGNAVVQANGIGVTLVEGAGDLTADHVDIVMSGTPLVAELTDGGNLRDELEGSTQLNAHRGGDAQTGAIGDDHLTGGTTDDAIFGNEGDDTLLGGAGADALYGDDGDDVLSGGAGNDFLAGGSGDDTLTGGADSDLIFGGAGADVLEGGEGHDALQGGPGADTILGGDGQDVIDGTFAAALDYTGVDEDAGDLIDAGAGDDTIRIGSGDEVIGGEGEDVFITGGDGTDSAMLGTIRDFDPEADQIEIIHDPRVLSDPSIDVVDFPDGSGAEILLDGVPVLHVVGGQGLDPAQVILRASHTWPAAQDE